LAKPADSPPGLAGFVLPIEGVKAMSPIEQNRSELIEAWHAAASSYSQRKSDGLSTDGTWSYLDSLMDEYLETLQVTHANK
jgi:hypothetical protein